MGMRILLAEKFSWRLIRTVAGMKSAAAPIFCMKLEMKATVREISARIRFSLRPTILTI
ncbi:MAG: hypothetical protein ACD_75C00833G0003 [uncultured bacterium]|nr:MAG: hypothetical protein ACD_75C00833G0003 [uncultured bacterium]